VDCLIEQTHPELAVAEGSDVSLVFCLIALCKVYVKLTASVLPLPCNDCVNVTLFLSLICTSLQYRFHYSKQSRDKINYFSAVKSKAFSVRVPCIAMVAKWNKEANKENLTRRGQSNEQYLACTGFTR